MEVREFLFDTRVVERHIQRRTLKREEYEKHLKSLEDRTGHFDVWPLQQDRFVNLRAELRSDRERMREFGGGEDYTAVSLGAVPERRSPARLRRAKLAQAVMEGEEAEVFAEQTRGSGIDTADMADLHIVGESRATGGDAD